jgi:esterase/lipase
MPEERMDVMFGQNADYQLETNLEQRGMQLIQNLLYYMNNNIRQTPPNLRSEAEALSKGMRKFLLKYTINLNEFDRLVAELNKDIYFIDSTYSVMDKITDQFSLLAGKALKFRARTVNIPQDEYHFLFKGFRSPLRKTNGTGLRKLGAPEGN